MACFTERFDYEKCRHVKEIYVLLFDLVDSNRLNSNLKLIQLFSFLNRKPLIYSVKLVWYFQTDMIHFHSLAGKLSINCGQLCLTMITSRIIAEAYIKDLHTASRSLRLWSSFFSKKNCLAVATNQPCCDFHLECNKYNPLLLPSLHHHYYEQPSSYQYHFYRGLDYNHIISDTFIIIILSPTLQCFFNKLLLNFTILHPLPVVYQYFLIHLFCV